MKISIISSTIKIRPISISNSFLWLHLLFCLWVQLFWSHTKVRQIAFISNISSIVESVKRDSSENQVQYLEDCREHWRAESCSGANRSQTSCMSSNVHTSPPHALCALQRTMRGPVSWWSKVRKGRMLLFSKPPPQVAGLKRNRRSCTFYDYTYLTHKTLICGVFTNSVSGTIVDYQECVVPAENTSITNHNPLNRLHLNLL